MSLWLAGGCRDEPRPPIVWTGQHVRFGTSEDLEGLCDGTLPYLDAYAGYLQERLAGDGTTIDYYWVPRDAERAELCPVGVLACTRGREVFSGSAPDEHELVHAVHYRDRVAARVLEEGFAELYGDDADVRVPPLGDIEDLLRTDEGTAVSPLQYPLAGHFVSYLASAYDESRLHALARDSNLADPFERTAAVFERVYGLSLASAIEDYRARYPVCTQLAYRDNRFDCAAEATPVTPAGVALSVSMDCGDPQVLGPRYGERWSRRVLEVSEDGEHRIALTRIGGTRGGRARITRCGVGCAEAGRSEVQTLEAAPDAPGEGTICLGAGRHVVRFAVAADDDGMLELRAEPTGSPCP